MVFICVSTTTPVNPPETTPRLSHGDLWKALVSKARHPEEFVSAIESSRIVEESDTGLKRAVQFKGELGNGGEVVEEVRYVGMMKVCSARHFPALYVRTLDEFIYSIMWIRSTSTSHRPDNPSQTLFPG